MWTCLPHAIPFAFGFAECPLAWALQGLIRVFFLGVAGLHACAVVGTFVVLICAMLTVCLLAFHDVSACACVYRLATSWFNFFSPFVLSFVSPSCVLMLHIQPSIVAHREGQRRLGRLQLCVYILWCML